MIEINGLNKYYKIRGGKFHVLKDISLTVKDGERLAIVGKSGAGKSTLLHIMGLLDNYDSGSYQLNGTEISTLKDSSLASLRNKDIGFVMQDFSLMNHKSVLMNVMLPLYFNNKYNEKQMKEKGMEMLKTVGLEAHAQKKAVQLSGGERQRVSIARALITNPSIILADEPTGSLDTDTRDEIMSQLVELNKKNNITLIVITHDKAVAEYCTRKLVINEGIITNTETK